MGGLQMKKFKFNLETFARKMILLSGKAKMHGKREFMRYK